MAVDGVPEFRSVWERGLGVRSMVAWVGRLVRRPSSAWWWRAFSPGAPTGGLEARHR